MVYSTDEGATWHVTRVGAEVPLGLNNEEDIEGRTITSFYNNLVIVNSYIPNGSRRLEYKKLFIKRLTTTLNDLVKHNKNIILCFDANIAHKELDVNKPKETSKKSGFLLEERILFDKLLNNNFIDSFRELNPKTVQYTWKSYRARKENEDFGWRFRFDYIICSKSIENKILKCYSKDLNYSDHLPVILETL